LYLDKVRSIYQPIFRAMPAQQHGGEKVRVAQERQGGKLAGVQPGQTRARKQRREQKRLKMGR